jgi:hypothetical protein
MSCSNLFLVSYVKFVGFATFKSFDLNFKIVMLIKLNY